MDTKEMEYVLWCETNYIRNNSNGLIATMDVSTGLWVAQEISIVKKFIIEAQPHNVFIS